MSARVSIAYGRGKLELDIPCAEVSVIEPKRTAGLPDEKVAVLDALKSPTDSAPLGQWLSSDKRICITFSDITRPTPNDRIIPWLLEYLRSEGVSREQITLLNGN